jgi:hypothetical protein
MDVLENIIERIAQTEEQRDAYLRHAEVEEQKIAKLESLYSMLEDPTTQELMKDVIVGMAVQNGVAVPNGNTGGTGEKHYVGMQRVREYVTAMPAGATFTVHEVFAKSIEHTPSNPKLRHPEFEKQRKASISLALTSMVKAGDLEIAKQGRGRENTVYRRPEGK